MRIGWTVVDRMKKKVKDERVQLNSKMFIKQPGKYEIHFWAPPSLSLTLLLLDMSDSIDTVLPFGHWFDSVLQYGHHHHRHQSPKHWHQFNSIL